MCLHGPNTFGCVPTEIVDSIIEEHGGLDIAKINEIIANHREERKND